jgi:hypothetical protein
MKTDLERANWLAAYQRRWRGCEPPPGYISVPEYARRIHLSPEAVNRWVRLGWCTGRTWQTPGGRVYVPADTPPREDGRKNNRWHR